MTNLDDVRTFLGKVHTAATAKHVGEHGNKVDTIVDASYQRILVFPGELIGQDFNHYSERYLVKLSETSEANLTTALKNIIDGIEKLNTGQPITSYTKPNTLCSVTLANGKQSFKNFSSNRWYKDLYIDFEWSTS